MEDKCMEWRQEKDMPVFMYIFLNKIEVDLTIIVGFNILAAALMVAANFIFELSICVVMSGCMCACVDSIFSKPCGS